METKLHPFEAAGLGRYPYRFLGVYSKVYSPVPGYSQPGGCCQYCSRGIKYVAQFRSADGKTFETGLDCAMRADDELGRAAGHALKAYRANGPVRLLTNVIAFVARHNQWAEAEAQRVESERLEAEKRAQSKHVGIIGKRQAFTVTVEGAPYYDGVYGRTYMRKFRTQEGDLIVWKTSGPAGYDNKAGEWVRLEEGNTIQITGRVEAHGEYKGEKQTFISRAKFTPV